MATNKISLRTTEEFMNDYVPTYNPIYPIFLGKSQAYSEEVGIQKWNRLEAVADLRAKHISPKDTEMKQVSVKDSSKTFNKYFLANQYTQSQLQGREDVEGIVAQVLDEHQKQFDEMVLLGEGTDATNVVNNGLYWSGDRNYTLEGSEAVASAPNTQSSFYDLLMTNAEDARDVGGRKAIIVYGSLAISKLNSIVPDQALSLRKMLEEGLSGEANIIKLPKDITPAGANGWIIVNLDQVKFHYTVLPALKDQNVNSEKMYSWHNFLMGSAMIEVLSPNAIIRQPVTFA